MEFRQRNYIELQKTSLDSLKQIENVVLNYQGSKKDTKLFHTEVYSIEHCI